MDNTFISYNRISNTKSFSESRHFGDISFEKVIYRFKIICLGNLNVGKTSIFNRFIENKFDLDYKCTVSVDFKLKSLILDDYTVADLQIWDTCGQELYRTITRQYYRDSHGCILVYDVTNLQSFEDLIAWIEDLQTFGPQDIPVIIVGNKCDLTQHRVISFERANDFAKQYSYDYMEVSAKQDINIGLLFEVLTKTMIITTEELAKSVSEKKQNPFMNKSRNDKSILLKERNSLQSINKKRSCC